MTTVTGWHHPASMSGASVRSRELLDPYPRTGHYRAVA